MQAVYIDQKDPANKPRSHPMVLSVIKRVNS